MPVNANSIIQNVILLFPISNKDIVIMHFHCTNIHVAALDTAPLVLIAKIFYCKVFCFDFFVCIESLNRIM